ncbi:NAD(P)-binding protein [Favolaschia claudopus]|uniref:NAD(P)-binding protein n=1 Tax=Favolaschia claudopus TaxID=2862362 RepID=A0AAW0CRX6_9AGAR
MSDNTVYLISGANRGIGYGLASALAVRPNVIVFAGTRNLSAESLQQLKAKHPNVHPVKLTSGDQEDNEAAIAHIQRVAGRLDVVIANAGIANHSGPLTSTPLSAFHEHFEVNTLGPVVLFQAAHKLLLAFPNNTPIFAVISSVCGSMNRFMHISATPYGMSKAAANFLIKTLDVEHPTLVAMAIDPGWTETDMGNRGAKFNGLGLEKAPVRLEDSVKGILLRIDGATKEQSSGRFWNFRVTNGSSHPWDVDTEEVPW